MTGDASKIHRSSFDESFEKFYGFDKEKALKAVIITVKDILTREYMKMFFLTG